MGKEVTLSLNPSYLCNFSCDFCYLTPTQLRDPRRLDLNLLSDRLIEVTQAGLTLRHVDLYGGEVGVLPQEYFLAMKDRLAPFYSGPINIISNFSKVPNFFYDEDVDMTVSFDFEAREKSELVFQNILTFRKPLSVLMLASPRVLAMDVDLIISTFNSMSHVISVEIKPYSTNQANQMEVSFLQFENFVKKWIKSQIPKKFEFINELNLKDTLGYVRNAYSDDHLYLNPNAKWAVLEFDDQDHEFFLELDTVRDYFAWTQKEKNRVQKNKICQSCSYLGRCLTEHYRDVKSLNASCNGFKSLIDWYQNQSAQGHQPRGILDGSLVQS